MVLRCISRASTDQFQNQLDVNAIEFDMKCVGVTCDDVLAAFQEIEMDIWDSVIGWLYDGK